MICRLTSLTNPPAHVTNWQTRHVCIVDIDDDDTVKLGVIHDNKSVGNNGVTAINYEESWNQFQYKSLMTAILECCNQLNISLLVSAWDSRRKPDSIFRKPDSIYVTYPEKATSYNLLTRWTWLSWPQQALQLFGFNNQEQTFDYVDLCKIDFRPLFKYHVCKQRSVLFLDGMWRVLENAKIT